MLIERTGREFGIAVMVTSHLLGEIERVCDSLIAIDAGKLQYAGPVSNFTERTQRLRVEVDDDMPAFAAALRARGLEVETAGSELRITIGDDSAYDVVRDTAADLSVPLSRMEITRHKLEELFKATSNAEGPPWLSQTRQRFTISDTSHIPVRDSDERIRFDRSWHFRCARHSELVAAKRRR